MELIIVLGVQAILLVAFAFYAGRRAAKSAAREAPDAIARWLRSLKKSEVEEISRQLTTIDQTLRDIQDHRLKLEKIANETAFSMMLFGVATGAVAGSAMSYAFDDPAWLHPGLERIPFTLRTTPSWLEDTWWERLLTAAIVVIGAALVTLLFLKLIDLYVKKRNPIRTTSAPLRDRLLAAAEEYLAQVDSAADEQFRDVVQSVVDTAKPQTVDS